MKICVTGATGFVGAALCDLLAVLGHSVIKVVRRDLGPGSIAVGEISAATSWAEAVAGCDVVVHLAARVHVMQETVADPVALFDAVNTIATRNLVLAAARAGVKRFVFVSTVKVNGESTAPGHPFTENDAPAPQDAYAWSKYQAEEELKRLAHQHAMEFVIIRSPLVYGPGVKANFASLMRLVARAWPLPLGGIHNQRSLVGLGNLVDFIATCVAHPNAANQTFLVSDGQDLSTTELVRAMACAAGVTARLLPVPAGLLLLAGTCLGQGAAIHRLCDSLQVDIAKARTLLGWVPPHSVSSGLVRAYKGTSKQ